jgi:DNA repair exonuclease SbcCD ATPase subunit
VWRLGVVSYLLGLAGRGFVVFVVVIVRGSVGFVGGVARWTEQLEKKMESQSRELHEEIQELRDKHQKQEAEIERLDSCVDQQLEVNEKLADKIKDQEEEIERLRAALAKSCEEGRDEMYDCGYNRLRAALERIAEGCDLSNEAQAIAREALDDE